MKVMVNGLPGKMATVVAERIDKEPGFELVPYALAGSRGTDDFCVVGGVEIRLVRPVKRNLIERIERIKADHRPFLSVDYTRPDAVNENADFYCKHNLPFVMGTTGGDRKALEQRVRDSDIVAVIAPNMAKQIVAFQAMMQYAAETFPGAFKDYKLEIFESHQAEKEDTSGTAKAMVSYFNKLGIPFTEKQIVKVRIVGIQEAVLGVPKEALGGHAWHTYTLKSEDGSVLFRFTHNMNGRDAYAAGTLDALKFLELKVGEKGKVYSMIDVLRGL